MKKKAKKPMAMNKLSLNIEIEESGWESSLPDISALSKRVMSQTFEYVQSHDEIDFLAFDKPTIINLALSNDESVRHLNAQFRNMDKPTNVLSFANIDDENFDNDIQTFDEIELGDIMIALETMQREAAELNISLQHHYCHLLTHGFLHLLGFDHMEDEEAEYMETFETAILQQMNIQNPYAE